MLNYPHHILYHGIWPNASRINQLVYHFSDDAFNVISSVWTGFNIFGKGTGKATKKVINGFDNLSVHVGKQGKHIVGHNNYIKGRSIISGKVDDIQKLIDDFAGTGQWKTANKEMVDFGKNIGKYVDINTGEIIDTIRGIIHYSKKGVHIVPAKPIP